VKTILILCPARDINPNEELFIDYGETFWVGKLSLKD
jgi:hypothetical protein